MNSLFPIGFPWPTAMYLTLFIMTATIYMLCMNYVVAGAMVLVLGYLAPGAQRRIEAGSARSGSGLILKIVRDWLPASFGVAVTTGIAPLLFLQILYKRQFYTAELLLFHLWMLLLPALIMAFSVLYLIKSQALIGRWASLRGPASVVAFVCLFFTAWLWTDSHVLSIHNSSWESLSMSHNFVYRNAEVWPRLGYWLTASFSTLAVALGWQLYWGRRLHDPVNTDLATRRLRLLAILGLAMSAAEAWLWLLYLDAPARNAILSILAFPYALLVLAGMGTQAAGWLQARRGADLTPRRLALISIGAIATILGSLVVREARRLAAIDITGLFEAHRQAAQAGGMGVFLCFFAANLAVITSCVVIVRRAPRPLH